MISDSFSTKKIGDISETRACEFLIDNGYSIVERNYRFSRYGEIDIIAKKNGIISFVEVKARRTKYFGMPSEAVNIKKQNKIKFVAKVYLSNINLQDENIRFDVFEIIYSIKNDVFIVIEESLLENAF